MPAYLAIGLPGGQEWLWIVLIIVILFGAKKLPELARGIGRSIGEFKKAKDEFDREIQSAAEPSPQNNPTRPSPTGTIPATGDPLLPTHTATNTPTEKPQA